MPSSTLAVGLTDLVLVAVSFLLCALYRVGTAPLRPLVRVFFFLVGCAAVAGTVFHLYFPSLETRTGWLLSLAIAVFVGLAAVSLWLLTAYALTGARHLRPVGWLALVAFAGLISWHVSVDLSFTPIVAFYSPAMIAFGAASLRNMLRGEAGWGLLSIGVGLSIAAALTQLSTLRIGDLHHNSLYHLVQALALLVLFQGFRKVRSDWHLDRAVLPASISPPRPAPGSSTARD